MTITIKNDNNNDNDNQKKRNFKTFLINKILATFVFHFRSLKKIKNN